jgi:adenosylcobinamide-phosphate synthase
MYDSALILLLALAIDLLVGEPPASVHLTVWVGKFIERLEAPLRKSVPNERAAGAVLALLSIVAFSLLALLITETASYSWLLYIALSAVFLKMTFAFRCMFSHTIPIMKALDGDLEASRKLLSRVVRRSTRDLDRRLVASGAVETVAEGFVDGFISPLFYFCIFGLVGAVAYRVISTLDSMVGYMDERYAKFGWFSAKLDTIANYLPARLTYPIFALSAFVSGMDWRSAVRIAKRDHRITKSKNAGWPMSTMAGALNVRLEKVGYYALGDDVEQLAPKKIWDSLKVFTISAVIVCFSVIAITIFGGMLYEAYLI